MLVFLMLMAILSKFGCCYYPKFPILAKTAVTPYKTWKTYYIPMKVDHFGWSNQHRFKLRYLIADQFWDVGHGPIFFYTGNEGPIDTFCNNTGFMWDIAPKFKALLVFAEHRYYGESLPYGKKAYENIETMQYFTSEQALADYAELIRYLWTQYEVKSPVISFGGSYGGMLTAWFRMKYPHMVAGGIAASAPIWQFTGLTKCNVYNDIVTKDYALADKNCPDNIRRTWKLLNDLSTTVAGRELISKTFGLCSPLEKPADINSLKDYLNEIWGNMAMVNYPYATNFLAPLPAWPIKVACKPLSTPNLDGPVLLKALSQAAAVYYNTTGTVKCLNTSHTSNIGDLGWDFQACTEMVMPMCADGKSDMFEPSPWDYNAFSVGCTKRWKTVPVSTWITTHYGGRNIKAASNIVFSNGELDPWSGGGVHVNVSSSVYAISISDSAHHLDLRSSNPADPPSVKQARLFHEARITEWIKQARQTDSQRDMKLRFQRMRKFGHL
ncbi:lysosomal Pro-X carboxypeptidase-like isoform X2 [Tubulanus polymorphus]|uniref:lysosomal Pro-X carboxypeptidase-like isoform X2 n=1 Tax=Tubulanus polymorphus TaxID=672921 RepID=UPI003DA5BAE8